MLASETGTALINETYTRLKQAAAPSLTKRTAANDRENIQSRLWMFSGFKTDKQLREAATLMTDEQGGIRPYKEFREDVLKINETYNRHYLQVEYEMVKRSSEAFNRWKAFEGEDENEIILRYRTMDDDKVRHKHRALEGTTLPMSDPFWSLYYPPNGWNCRCSVQQVRAGKYKITPSDHANALGQASLATPKERLFAFNPGREKTLIPPKHPYLPKGCDGCKEQLAYGKGKKECQACQEIERSHSAMERHKYYDQMKPLLNKTVEKTVVINNKEKEIKIGFIKKGNEHLYSDALSRAKEVLLKEDLKDIDKRLKAADFVKSATLSKDRKDNIQEFYYFKDKEKELFYNVAKEVYKKSGGQIKIKYYLYSATTRLHK